MSASQMAIIAIGGIIALLLLVIVVAMVSRQSARRLGATIKATDAMREELFTADEKRREQWVEFYLASGEIEKAEELGHREKAQWQIHQEEQEAAEAERIEALPEALDLDDLLDD